MIAVALIASSVLFPDVKHGESPETMAPRRAAFALIRQGKFDEAVSPLRTAADEGDRLALYQLGVLYETGKAVPQSYKLAWECYSKSADKGLLASNHKLGLFYFFGWYVQKSKEQAKHFWLKGAYTGFAPSEYLWATTVLSLKKPDTTPDNVEAIRWLIKAARQNMPEATCLLGVMYEIGFGVKQDVPLAYVLEQRSIAGDFEIEPEMKSVAKTVLERLEKKEIHSKITKDLTSR